MSVEEIVKLADQMGSRIAREYPGIEAEDIAQAALAGLLEDDVDYGGYSVTPEFVSAVLHRHGVAYAAKERYDYVVSTSTYLYTPKEVKALLSEAYFNEDAWDVPTGDDDYLSATVAGKSIVVGLLDIQKAWKRLSNYQSDVLWRKYYDGGDIERKTLSRAVESLTRYMNTGINSPSYDHDGPGARTAMTNAQAQYVTRSQW